MRLEATGNTQKEAENNLNAERKAIELRSKEKFIYSDVVVYGNFELGYKLVQEYKNEVIRD